jgi:signal transduction histidine kinase/ActR/RegA family two-component response regulator
VTGSVEDKNKASGFAPGASSSRYALNAGVKGSWSDLLRAFPAVSFSALFLCYFILSVIGIRWAIVPGAASPIWPAAGVALAGLLLGGQRLWPAIFLGRMATYLATGTLLPLSAQLAIAAGNAVSAVLGAEILNKAGGGSRLKTSRDAVLLIIAALLSSMLSAFIGASAIFFSQKTDFAWLTFAEQWWAGHFAGVLVLAPAILGWAGERSVPENRLWWSQLLVSALLSTAVSYLVFGPEPTPWAKPWLIFPALVWAALACGVRGGTTSLLTTGLVAVWGTTAGYGPFNENVSAVNSFLPFFLLAQYLAVSAITTVILAVVAEERRGNEILRRSEAALQEADRRKDEFLAILAHELRNPLAPIRSGVELLRMNGVAESQQDVLEVMESQVGQLVRLVDDLLDVSRITRGKLELVREHVNLSAIIHSALETSKPLLQELGHEVVLSLSPQPLIVEGDPVRLTQTIANLLHNAGKYTPKKGQVFVTTLREGNQAVIKVRDTGIGIPEELIGRVFELFTQVDSHLKHAQGGIGVGLAIVRRLVEMHGGRIDATSEGPGKGAEFVVHLPLTTEFSEAQKNPEAIFKEENGLARRILVVDDNVDAAKTLSMMLRLYGHDVRTSYDGESGVAEAKEFKPELVLLDLGLPGMDGYTTAVKLREIFGSELTLVALTGWGQAEDRRRTELAGFNRHLVKPASSSELLEIIAKLPSAKQVAFR